MPANRDEWLALRGKRVGASEVAALFDAQAPYALSRYALWHVKAGLAPAPDVGGQRVQAGIMLEAAIAHMVAEANGWTISKGRYAICDDCPYLAASLDFEIAAIDDRGPGVLEVKNVDWLVHRRTWEGEPPLHIMLQLQSQVGCAAYKWGAVGALVGGNDTVTHKFDARPKLFGGMKRRATEFWQSIDAGKPPPVDGSDGAADVLRALYPEVIDDALDMRESNEWPEACADFLKAQEARKAADGAYDLARNRVESMLAGSKRGWGSGFSASVSVTAEKPDRMALPNEVIKGRKETRRIIIKETQP